MQTIEIICVDQVQPLQLPDLPFAVETETELISHRSPTSLFQQHFDELRGYIYHLGNPNLRDPTVFERYTAHELLSREEGTEWWDIVHFGPEFVPSIKTLLEQLLLTSPRNNLLFTSDYQFGPDTTWYKRPITLEKFWQLHDERRLKMNALYRLKP